MAKGLRRKNGRLGRHVFGNVVVVEEPQGGDSQLEHQAPS
jgi:hypothetical protein